MSKSRRDAGDHVMDTYYGQEMPPRLRQGSRNSHASRTRLLESMYTRVLSEMAIGRFKWEGLPPEIDARFVEMELFYSGLVVFFQDGKGGYNSGKYVASRAASLGTPNLYDNPTSYRTYGGFSGYPDQTLPRKKVVPIWANALRQTDQDIIQVFAWELANMKRTIEINADSARMPKVVATTENQKLGLTNMVRQINEGVPVITVDRNQFDPSMITVLDLSIHPNAITEMDILFVRTYSQCMGLLGIDNANQDKKERLVTSEVDANAQQVYSIKRSNLNEREAACERINKKFGLNVSVGYHVDDMPDSSAGVAGEDGTSEDGMPRPGSPSVAPMVNNIGK